MTQAQVIELVRREVGARIVVAAEYLVERIRDNISLEQPWHAEKPDPDKWQINPHAPKIWGENPSIEGEFPKVASGDLRDAIQYFFDHVELTATVGVNTQSAQFAHESNYWVEMEEVYGRSFMLRTALEELTELQRILASDPANAVAPF